MYCLKNCQSVLCKLYLDFEVIEGVLSSALKYAKLKICKYFL